MRVEIFTDMVVSLKKEYKDSIACSPKRRLIPATIDVGVATDPMVLSS